MNAADRRIRYLDLRREEEPGRSSSQPDRLRRQGRRRTKRALGYVWVASRQAAAALGDAREQRERIAEFARAEGLRLLDIVEERTSALRRGGEPDSGNRAVLFDVLELAKNGEFDLLLFGAATGLTDESGTRAFLERRLRQSGVELVSVRESDEEPSVVAARDILTAVDELERAFLMRQLSAGKAKKKALGRHVHGRAPYGYRSESGRLRPIASLVPVVERIFRQAADGRSPGLIARGLNVDRVQPPQSGKAWSEQGVRVILANPAYLGERYGVTDAHEAVIARRLWTAAQNALDARRRD